MKTQVVSLRLPPDMVTFLEEKAAEKGTDRATYIIGIIQNHVLSILDIEKISPKQHLDPIKPRKWDLPKLEDGATQEEDQEFFSTISREQVHLQNDQEYVPD